jgi:DNA-binding response OmpR family regulator
VQAKGDVLVVDDDQPTVDFIVEVLREEGYAVRAAKDAAHAREAIVLQPPDLLLLDLHLPGKDGDVLVHDLRDDELADVPVVLMTADERATHTLVMDGIAFCLVKPFHLEALFECVARYIRPQRDNAVGMSCIVLLFVTPLVLAL